MRGGATGTRCDEGWQGLLRAYMVAGEPDKLRRINDLIKGLGLQG
jgi:hypothetical protein